MALLGHPILIMFDLNPDQNRERWGLLPQMRYCRLGLAKRRVLELELPAICPAWETPLMIYSLGCPSRGQLVQVNPKENRHSFFKRLDSAWNLADPWASCFRPWDDYLATNL